MKNILFLLLSLITVLPSNGQSSKNDSTLSVYTISTDIFKVVYSEIYQQPIELSYMVTCNGGDISRRGLDFKKYDGVITSDDDDYKNNIWDKGHLAPAADFNCYDSTLRSTFSYLNCALQHEGLNRGPWKELERFERDLSGIFAFVNVTITVHFRDEPERWLPTGALIPVGFTKVIWCDGEKFEFYFPNEDVSGTRWIKFKVN